MASKLPQPEVEPPLGANFKFQARHVDRPSSESCHNLRLGPGPDACDGDGHCGVQVIRRAWLLSPTVTTGPQPEAHTLGGTAPLPGHPGPAQAIRDSFLLGPSRRPATVTP